MTSRFLSCRPDESGRRKHIAPGFFWLAFGSRPRIATNLPRSKRSKYAMERQTRLLIIEPLMGPPNELTPGHFADMNFLVTFSGGRVRTEEENPNLLRQTGFRLQKNLPTASEVSVLAAFAA